MFRKLNPVIYFCFSLFTVLLLSLPWVNAAESDNPPTWQIDGILAALDDPYPEVQGLAFEKLAEYDAEDMQTALENPEEIARKATNILQDDTVDLWVRRSAAEALKNLGEAATPYIPIVVGTLRDDTVDLDVRDSIAERLGNLGEAATPHIQAILNILQDEKVDFWVRLGAVVVFGNLVQRGRNNYLAWRTS